MKPQILDLDSEALEEFRQKFETAIGLLLRNMIRKDILDGEVGGKLKIKLTFGTDKETGEQIVMPEITPDVHIKVGAKAKMECVKRGGMILQTTPCGQPVVASNQITMDELIEADRKGA